MRKLVFVFAALLVTSMFSCIDGGQDNQQEDQQELQGDSTELATDTAAIEVTGVAIDGAMNSISLLVGDDTLYFSYPDLDDDHRGYWDINDSVTVRYYVTEEGVDSVTDVINRTSA